MTRIRLPACRTLPSRVVRTPSISAIFRMSSSFPPACAAPDCPVSQICFEFLKTPVKRSRSLLPARQITIA